MLSRLERQFVATYSTRSDMTGRLHDADYLNRLERHLETQGAIDRSPSMAVLTAAVSTASAWVIFSATVLVLAADISAARLVLLVLWVLLSVFAVLRPTAALAFGGNGEPGPAVRRRVLAVWASTTSFAIASFVGTGLFLPFVGMVGLLAGTRLAGSDASAAIERAPGYYIRRWFSLRGLLSCVLAIGFVTANAIVWSSLLGPFVATGSLALTWPDTSQTLQVTAALFVVIPLVLAVCELIAAVGRRETRMFAHLSEALRTNERDRVAQDLHDRALSLLSAARLYPPDHPGHDRALDQLEMNLRSMQFECELDASDLTLDRCCRRSRALADLGGMQFSVLTTDHVLAQQLDRPVALLIDQLLHNLVSNSVGAEATRASVTLGLTDDGRLAGTFDDNAGGFDAKLAMQRGGGLSRLRQALDLIGGSFVIAPRGLAIDFELPTSVTEPNR